MFQTAVSINSASQSHMLMAVMTKKGFARCQSKRFHGVVGNHKVIKARAMCVECCVHALIDAHQKPSSSQQKTVQFRICDWKAL